VDGATNMVGGISNKVMAMGAMTTVGMELMDMDSMAAIITIIITVIQGIQAMVDTIKDIPQISSKVGSRSAGILVP